MSDIKENQKRLSQIVGEQLSGVNFVMDYLRLQFNDLSLTVLTPLVVHETNRNLSLGDLRLTSRHGDRYRGRPRLQRP